MSNIKYILLFLILSLIPNNMNAQTTAEEKKDMLIRISEI